MFARNGFPSGTMSRPMRPPHAVKHERRSSQNGLKRPICTGHCWSTIITLKRGVDMVKEDTCVLPMGVARAPGNGTVHQPHALTLNEIRQNAYRRWEAAGRPSGDCSRFWLEAEQELLQEEPASRPLSTAKTSTDA